MRKYNNGQNTLEYVVVIAMVAAALVAMQFYVKRSVQGKLRQSTDEIGQQFEAGQTSVTSTRGRTGKTVQTAANGVTTTAINASTPETVTESGNEQVAAW